MTVNPTYACKSLVPGKATGPVLHANVGLSFMGGVDPGDGTVIDTHHPLLGETVAGKVLTIPSGRGSCAGSLVIFELLMNGNAPAALVFQQKETILTLGAVIAEELFGCGIPVVSLPGDDFNALAHAGFARIEDDALEVSDRAFAPEPSRAVLQEPDLSRFTLMPSDRSVLAGAEGPAAQAALRIVIRTALLEGVSELVSVEKAHIDGCFYHGPAGVAFARKLQNMGAKVRVPSTMNALCVDRRQWREQGVAPALGAASDDLAEAYVAMGVQPTYTCAPYLLPDPPTFGQQIAWGESNAVAFANSVLGARTLKYPDYLDILVAITGRAPAADCHLDAPRHARVRIDVPPPHDLDDAYFALLGYLVGKLTPNHIPVIVASKTRTSAATT